MFPKEERIKLIKDLEYYRLENELTVNELASMLGVSNPTIVRWESGVFLPNKIQAFKIQKLLNTKNNGQLSV